MNSTHIFAATTVLLAAIICFGFATAPSRSPDQDMESRVMTPAPALAHKQRFGHRITLSTQIPAGNQQVKPCVALPLVPSADNPENCDATPNSSLVYYQRFETEALEPTVGDFPNGTLVQGTIVPGKDGNALHIQAREAGAVVSMPAGSIGPAGCIEFWARIDNGDGLCTGTSFCPQFFSVFADGDNRIGIDFCTNFGHYDCGATFHFWGLAFATTYKG